MKRLYTGLLLVSISIGLSTVSLEAFFNSVGLSDFATSFSAGSPWSNSSSQPKPQSAVPQTPAQKSSFFSFGKPKPAPSYGPQSLANQTSSSPSLQSPSQGVPSFASSVPLGGSSQFGRCDWYNIYPKAVQYLNDLSARGIGTSDQDLTFVSRYLELHCAQFNDMIDAKVLVDEEERRSADRRLTTNVMRVSRFESEPGYRELFTRHQAILTPRLPNVDAYVAEVKAARQAEAVPHGSPQKRILFFSRPAFLGGQKTAPTRQKVTAELVAELQRIDARYKFFGHRFIPVIEQLCADPMRDPATDLEIQFLNKFMTFGCRIVNGYLERIVANNPSTQQQTQRIEQSGRAEMAKLLSDPLNAPFMTKYAYLNFSIPALDAALKNYGQSMKAQQQYGPRRA